MDGTTEGGKVEEINGYTEEKERRRKGNSVIWN